MFEIIAEKGRARAGVLHTGHGKMLTPCLLPVATKGAAKLLTNQQLQEMGAQAIITNALLLYLKPGIHTIKKIGSLHDFFGWQKPIFTDSGGFQSLSENIFLGISDKGIRFKNPFTLQKMFFTPKNSIEIQNTLSSDAAFCLDHMPKANSTKETATESLERTTLWARECRKAHKNKKQLLFGIAQGGTFKDLRKRSGREIAEIGFDGYAVGGLGIGEKNSETLEMAKESKKAFPKEKPVHLMGVGSASEIVQSIALGIDIFDSCFPTRMARHATFFSGKKAFNIGKKVFEKQKKPLDENCGCYTCTSHSAALLHHLFKVKEQNAQLLLSIHNMHFTLDLVQQARKAIIDGKWKEFEKKWQ